MQDIIFVDAIIGDDDYDGITLVPEGGNTGPKRSIVAGVHATPDDGCCMVAPGEYSGPTVFIDRPIMLVGAGPDKTFINALSNSQQIIRVLKSGASISNFTIRGGFYGILIYDCSPRITNNVVVENYIGISIVLGESSAHVLNNTVSRNKAVGVRVWQSGESVLRNNIISGNGTCGIGCGESSPVIAYNDVWGHKDDYYGCAPGEGGLAVPPMFREEGDYRLREDSPCRDAGDPDKAYNDLGGTRNDMGAFGGPGAFLPKKLHGYPKLLGHPGVEAATALTSDQRLGLMTALEELEFAAAGHWADLENNDLRWLAESDLETIWLRRLAMVFYHEVNQVFPWSILDYEQTHLHAFLSFQVGNPEFDLPEIDECMGFHKIEPYSEERYAFDSLVWAANPLSAMEVMARIRDIFQPATPAAALYALIQYMRDLGWLHADVAGWTYGFSWEDLPHHLSGNTYTNGEPIRYWNYDVFFAARGSGCWQGSALIRETMRAFNVPVIKGNNAYGHQGVYAPTLDRIMVHGDDIFSLTRKHIPPVHSFRTRAWYEGLLEQGETAAEMQCGFKYRERKEHLLDWFSYYASSEYGAELAIHFSQYYQYDAGILKNMLTTPVHDAWGNNCPDAVLLEDPEIGAWVDFLADYYGF